MFIIMNDPLVNIEIDVNPFINIYSDLNVNQVGEYAVMHEHWSVTIVF